MCRIFKNAAPFVRGMTRKKGGMKNLGAILKQRALDFVTYAAAATIGFTAGYYVRSRADDPSARTREQGASFVQPLEQRVRLAGRVPHEIYCRKGERECYNMDCLIDCRVHQDEEFPIPEDDWQMFHEHRVDDLRRLLSPDEFDAFVREINEGFTYEFTREEGRNRSETLRVEWMTIDTLKPKEGEKVTYAPFRTIISARTDKYNHLEYMRCSRKPLIPSLENDHTVEWTADNKKWTPTDYSAGYARQLQWLYDFFVSAIERSQTH